MRTLCLLPFFVAFLFVPLPAANWSQFRGDDGRGISTDVLPQEWGTASNVLWSVALPGSGLSQPIVWKDRVYVSSAETAHHKKPNLANRNPGFPFPGPPPDAVYRWNLHCLDARTGTELWKKVLHEGRPRTPVHANNSYATETPATDGEHVVAYFGMTGLFVLDVLGNEIWKKDLGAFPTQSGWGSGSSPVLFGESVFIQCDNEKESFLVAFKLKTGEEIWRVKRSEKSNWATPFIWKNKLRTELITAGGSRMRSYDPATGKLFWELAGHGRTSTSPIGNAELLFLDSYDRMMGVRGKIVAVKPGAEGDISLKAEESHNEFVAWSVNFSGTRLASPLLYENNLYLPMQSSPVLQCLDAATGTLRYKERLPGGVGITASPWAANGNVYILDESGNTFVVKGGNGFTVLGTHRLEDAFWASPAVAGKRLFLRGVDKLWCLQGKE